MVRMFKSLDETWLKGFLEVSNSVFEGTVIEFFANAKVIAGTIVSFIANRKMVITKAPNKNKEMKVEYQLLHDIVAKALCAKAGSFGVVTSEKFDLMVAISVGLKVNWGQILFQTLVAMVHTSTKQSQGFAVQLSVLLERLLQADLGESVWTYTTSSAVHNSAGKGIFAPMEIRKINWATHFLSKIDPTVKDKEILEAFIRPNPVEEHCLLVLKSAWEDVSSKMSEYDKWVQFRTAGSTTSRWSTFLVPETSVAGDAENVDLSQITWAEKRKLLLSGTTPTQQEKPKILAIEFSTHAEHAQRAEKQPAQPEGQVEEIFRTIEDVEETEAMNSQEHQAQGNKQQAQVEERQAQSDEQKAQNEPDPEAEQDRQCPSPSGFQMVVNTAQRAENNIADKEEDFIQAGPQRINVPGNQVDTTKELTSLKDIVSSLGLQVDRVKDDTFMAKNTTLQFRNFVMPKRGKGRAVKREDCCDLGRI
ncbi:hypothetical protein F511_28847 [Dorcoceras hygrometricum]|uniref:Uncharacterized protein n=1 Tax=Dorcoceras hygrometricum TaxID=472368 RepID=A0A2Z7AKK9_9LAMI|nr:hypothetical protein F511_28847 [Dorcoceras hygrometricum]